MIIQVDEEGMMAIASLCDIALGLGRMKALGHVNRVLSNTKILPPPVPDLNPEPEPKPLPI